MFSLAHKLVSVRKGRQLVFAILILFASHACVKPAHAHDIGEHALCPQNYSWFTTAHITLSKIGRLCVDRHSPCNTLCVSSQPI